MAALTEVTRASLEQIEPRGKEQIGQSRMQAAVAVTEWSKGRYQAKILEDPVPDRV